MSHKKSYIGRTYGFLPGGPSIKTQKLVLSLSPESALPKEVSMVSEFPENYDQGRLGSCVANGIAGLMERQNMINNYKWPHTPSRLFIYYNARTYIHTTQQDSGAIIADGIKGVNEFGYCPEKIHDGSAPNWLWTYDDNSNGIPIIAPAKFAKKPPKQCYDNAVLHKALKTESVALNRLMVLNTLAQKRPFTFGFAVYESFESEKCMRTGIMPVPNSNEDELGGHAVVAVGYILDRPMGDQGVKDWVIVRNSWGTKLYGEMKGNFLMPLDEVLCNPDLSSDAHTVDMVGYSK
jgi:C1A family cysteine protease